MFNHLLVSFCKKDVVRHRKIGMAERIRNMRAATNLSKDSPTQKRKAPIEVSPIPFDEDENTNLGLIFKRKRREFAALNTPTRMVGLHFNSFSCKFHHLPYSLHSSTFTKSRLGWNLQKTLRHSSQI